MHSKMWSFPLFLSSLLPCTHTPCLVLLKLLFFSCLPPTRAHHLVTSHFQFHSHQSSKLCLLFLQSNSVAKLFFLNQLWVDLKQFQMAKTYTHTHSSPPNSTPVCSSLVHRHGGVSEDVRQARPSKGGHIVCCPSLSSRRDHPRINIKYITTTTNTTTLLYFYTYALWLSPQLYLLHH